MRWSVQWQTGGGGPQLPKWQALVKYLFAIFYVATHASGICDKVLKNKKYGQHWIPCDRHRELPRPAARSITSTPDISLLDTDLLPGSQQISAAALSTCIKRRLGILASMKSMCVWAIESKRAVFAAAGVTALTNTHWAASALASDLVSFVLGIPGGMAECNRLLLKQILCRQRHARVQRQNLFRPNGLVGTQQGLCLECVQRIVHHYPAQRHDRQAVGLDEMAVARAYRIAINTPGGDLRAAATLDRVVQRHQQGTLRREHLDQQAQQAPTGRQRRPFNPVQHPVVFLELLLLRQAPWRAAPR